jgi:hypothetical protein
MVDEEKTQIALYIPSELLEQVDKIAERERRPRNTQLLMLIELGLKAKK